MIHRHIFLTISFAFALFVSCSPNCRVVWTEGDTDPDTRLASHVLEIQNPPSGTDWVLWFSQFRTPVTIPEDAPGNLEHLGGTLYRFVPSQDSHGQPIVLQYKARSIANQCRAPEGFHLQKKGERSVPVEASYSFLPSDPYPTFDYTPVETSVFDMIPRLKSIVPQEGTTDLSKAQAGDVQIVEGKAPGWYRITLDGDVQAEAADEQGAWYASVTLDNIKRNAGGEAVPNGVITDWPDLPYRGIMLDVSRNFTQKDDLLRLIGILAHYKVDYLHLHFGDDEGWRIEIDALPELTSYGAHRVIPTVLEDGTLSEPDGLMPTYCISADIDEPSSGNGFYSHSDFVEILRYAQQNHIVIIPEFDTPGHSRAAVKSMEVRAKNTGDRSCLLSEPEDKSEYVSVQDYTDNVINVALPSTYRFIETVFDGLIALYAEAGVPLEAIHVGGDEVPDGSWTGSPACLSLMGANGWTDPVMLKDYYLNRVLDIAEARGVRLAGWQDICQNIEPATLERLKENLFFANLWTVSHGRDSLPYQFADDRIPIVISSAPNCYMDFAYSPDKTERGLNWDGYVDERRTFSLLPYDMYRSVRWDDYGKIVDLSASEAGKTPLTPEGRKYIIGVQGQLFAETLRKFDHVTYYLFPKALGLFERGWNASPAWEGTRAADDPAFVADFDQFFSIIVQREYPYYDDLGISYHRH